VDTAATGASASSKPGQLAGWAADDAILGGGIVATDEARQQVLDAMRQAVRIPNEEARLARWTLLLGRLDERGLIGVQQIIKEGDADGRYYPAEHNAFWTRKGAVMGASAIEGVLKDGYQLNSPICHLASKAWGSAHPAEALAWVEQHTEHATRVLPGILGGVAAQDPTLATDYLLHKAPPEMRHSLTSTLSWEVLYRNGLGGMKSWFENLSQQPEVPSDMAQKAFRDLTEATASKYSTL
jgi:hypothetical protein